ncbi:Leucine Rich repeat, putative [Angomonas deanei]|uniref:Leucine Rich repeat, putative n=1 Tax=Angomonas deanei TaxID=59799 RepID=A0A7G2CKI7_9TRYP|nr:Leucine Rich repeat, putative [Angomonas deanei]
MSDDDDLFAVTYTSTQLPALDPDNKMDSLFAALKARFSHYRRKSLAKKVGEEEASDTNNGFGPESIVSHHATNSSEAVRVSYSGLGDGNLMTSSILEKSDAARPADPIAAHGERGPLYWEERELYVAAEDLCTHINGGVNYRLLCNRYQQLTDVVLTLLKEDMALIKTVEIYPQGTCDSALQRLQKLLQESVTMLEKSGIEVPEKLHELTSIVHPESPLGADVSSTASGPAPEPHRASRRATMPGGSVSLDMQPVVLSDVNERSGIAVPPPCEEVNPDGSPICGLLQRGSITSTPTLSAANITAAQGKSPDLVSPLKTEKVPQPTKNPIIDFKTYGTQLSGLSSRADSPNAAASATPRPPSGRPPVRTFTRDEQSPPPTETSREPPQQDEADEEEEGYYLPADNAVHLMGKERIKKLEELYGEGYHLDGMQLLLDVLGVVYKREYDQGELSTPESAFTNLRKDFTTRVAPVFEHNSRTFVLSTTDTTPLRSTYLMECLASRVKPNNFLLEVLQKYPEREIDLLAMNMEPIKDSGLPPLMSILPALYRLKVLDLRLCQLTDEGVSYIAEGVRYHPSLEKIVLSNNDITDESVPHLLTIIHTVPKLSQLALYGCPLSQEAKALLGNEVESPNVHVVYTPHKNKKLSSVSSPRADSAPPNFAASTPAAPTGMYAAAASGGPRLPHVTTPVRPSTGAARRPSDPRSKKMLPPNRRNLQPKK